MAVSNEEIARKRKQRREKESTIIFKGQELYNELMRGISVQSLTAVTRTLQIIEAAGVTHIINAFKDYDYASRPPYDDATLSPLGAAIARVIGEPIAPKRGDIKEKRNILDPIPLPASYNPDSQAIVKALIEANATPNSRSVFGLLCHTLANNPNGLFSEVPKSSAQITQQTEERKGFLHLLLIQGLDLNLHPSDLNPMIETAHYHKDLNLLPASNNKSLIERLEALAQENQPRTNLLHFISTCAKEEEPILDLSFLAAQPSELSPIAEVESTLELSRSAADLTPSTPTTVTRTTIAYAAAQQDRKTRQDSLAIRTPAPTTVPKQRPKS